MSLASQRASMDAFDKGRQERHCPPGLCDMGMDYCLCLKDGREAARRVREAEISGDLE
jgi:hypothetical protein